jgi:hypothetical protein
MHIKIIKTTVVGGKVRRAGDVVEASYMDGRFLIARGKAEVHTPPKKPPAKKKAPVNKAVAVDALETR